MLKKRFKQH